MKKTVLTAAFALAAFTAGTLGFSEGLSVSGYIRGGASVTVDGAGDDHSYSGDTWVGGDYFGGGSRQRMVLSYEAENAGVLMRYQHDGYNNFFSDGAVSWIMAYANFMDGKVVAEAGKINDRFTWSGGWQDSAFDWWGRGKGAAVAVKPVEGLVIEADVTDLFADTVSEEDSTVITDEKLLQLSAKYGCDDFFVTGGFAPAGYYYASFGLTSVKDFFLSVELFGETEDAAGYGAGDWTGYGVSDTYNDITVYLDYSGIEKTDLGLVAEATILDDCTMLKINPAVSYSLTDTVALKAEATVMTPASWDEDVLGEKPDTFATITPSVTFKASPKAEVTVWGTISTNDDYAKHAAGAGLKYSY